MNLQFSNKSQMTPTLFGDLSQLLPGSCDFVFINDPSGRVRAVKDCIKFMVLPHQRASVGRSTFLKTR